MDRLKAETLVLPEPVQIWTHAGLLGSSLQSFRPSTNPCSQADLLSNLSSV